jgi:hypothetical protein
VDLERLGIVRRLRVVQELVGNEREGGVGAGRPLDHPAEDRFDLPLAGGLARLDRFEAGDLAVDPRVAVVAARPRP